MQYDDNVVLKRSVMPSKKINKLQSRKGTLVKVCVIGPVRLIVNGNIQPLALQSSRLLLAYLALERNMQRRDGIAKLLWPNIDSEITRTRLRQAVYQLRIALGPIAEKTIIGDRHFIGLAPDRILLDTDELATAGEELSWQRVESLLSGPFLMGEQEPEGAWLLWRRRRNDEISNRVEATMDFLVCKYEQEGRSAMALQVANRWVAFSPFSDNANLAMMRVLSRDNVHAALAQYDLFQRRVIESQGRRPGPMVQNLRQRLVSTYKGLSPALPPTGAPATFRQIPVSVLVLLPILGQEDDRGVTLERVFVHFYPTIQAATTRFAGRLQVAPDGAMEIRFCGMDDGARRAVALAFSIIGQSIRNKTLRVGVHSGIMMACPGGQQDLIGEVPAIARSIAGHSTGEILVSIATLDRLDNAFSTRFAGVWQAPEGAMGFYKVLDSRKSPRRAAVPTVGRDVELQTLVNKWRIVQRTGIGAVMLIRGDAGIGKSHLLEDFRKVAGDVSWRTYQCLPEYSKIILSPVADVVRDLLEVNFSTRINKIEIARLLGEYGINDSLTVDLWVRWLDIGGQENLSVDATDGHKEILYESILEILAAGLGSLPRVIAIEDLHWADHASLELMSLLMEKLAVLPVLVIITARTTFALTTTNWPNCKEINLSPLSKANAARMAASIKPDRTEEWYLDVAQRSCGIPLFVRVLSQQTSSQLKESNANPTTISSEIMDVILARLEILGEALSVAQFASVLGPLCNEKLLSLICADSGYLVEELIPVLFDNYIMIRGAHGFEFYHELYRDAIYSGIPPEKRKKMHLDVAQFLVDNLEGGVYPEMIAEHFELGGNIAAAVPFWQRAGHRAMQLYAFKEAKEYLAKAIRNFCDHGERSEPWRDEIHLHHDFAIVSVMDDGYACEAARSSFAHILALCAQYKIGGRPYYAALWGIWLQIFSSGDMYQAISAAEKLLSCAQHCPDNGFGLTVGRFAKGVSLAWQGSVEEAYQLFSEGQKHWKEEYSHLSISMFGENLEISLHCYKALVLLLLCRPEESREEIAYARNLADTSGMEASVAYVSAMQLALDFFGNSTAAAKNSLLRIEEICNRESLVMWFAYSQVFRGWLGILEDESNQSIHLQKMQSGIDCIRNIWPSGLAFLSIVKSAALLSAGSDLFLADLVESRKIANKTASFLMTWHLLLQEANWYLNHVQPQDGKRAVRCLRKVQKCGVPFFSRLADMALLKVNGGFESSRPKRTAAVSSGTG